MGFLNKKNDYFFRYLYYIRADGRVAGGVELLEWKTEVCRREKVHVWHECGTRSCRFLEGNRNVRVCFGSFSGFGIDPTRKNWRGSYYSISWRPGPGGRTRQQREDNVDLNPAMDMAVKSGLRPARGSPYPFLSDMHNIVCKAPGVGLSWPKTSEVIWVDGNILCSKRKGRDITRVAEHSSSSKEDIDMKPAKDNWTWPSCWICRVSGRRNWNGASEGKVYCHQSATCGVADFWKGKLKVEERFS